MHQSFLGELAVFLVITAVIVPLLAKFRVNPVLGFLACGIIAGPYGAATIPNAPEMLKMMAFSDAEGVKALGEIGVVFLLFLIGLELAPARLWSMRRNIFGLGGMQVVVCAAVIGAAAWWWEHDAAAAVILGSALALSSTAVVMKMIMDRQNFASPMGQTSFSILLMQDLAVIPLIFLVSFYGDKEAGQGSSVWMSLLFSLGNAAAIIAAILVAGRFLARPVLRAVVSSRAGPEFFMAHILLIVMAASVATGQSGLSMALGAFLAGLVLSETEFRNQIEVDMVPFKGLFMGLFFISVGMSIDVRAVIDNLAWLFASVAGLFAIKAVVIGCLCRAFGLSWPLAIRTGITLGQAGEFAFVLIGMAIPAGVIDNADGQFMLMTASLTLALTPFAYWLGERAEENLLRLTASSYEKSVADVAEGMSGHVVIAGFGRTGQTVAKFLDEHQIPYLAVDTDGAALEELRHKGIPVFFGDASNLQTLRKVHAERARAIVLAMSDKRASRKMMENIAEHCPKTNIYARARDEEHGAELRQKGVKGVVLETEGLSLQLAAKVMESFDVPPSVITHMMEHRRF